MGEFLLFEAIVQNDFPWVERLLTEGANPLKRNDIIKSTLFVSAKHGALETAKTLLRYINLFSDVELSRRPYYEFLEIIIKNQPVEEAENFFNTFLTLPVHLLHFF